MQSFYKLTVSTPDGKDFTVYLSETEDCVFVKDAFTRYANVAKFEVKFTQELINISDPIETAQLVIKKLASLRDQKNLLDQVEKIINP